ncbi:MAG: hypothetical protein IJ774_03565 [Selenomonadaceae bacterium]|nr:hypothetical protein [Selenomonadaceae bacterium]
MTKEFLTDEQLETVCGANQIPQKPAKPDDKNPSQIKIRTTNDLKVPPLVTVPIPFIRIDEIEVKPIIRQHGQSSEGFTPKISEHLILRR